jgi:biotin carboxylase
MTRTLLCLGGGEYQLPAIEAAQQMGCCVVVVDGNPQASGMFVADKALEVDLRDLDGCLKVARENQIDGVIAMCTEVGIETCARVAQALRLPGIKPQTAVWATNKFAMRERLNAMGIPSPFFRMALTREEAEKAAGEIGYPLVVKPVDNAGSRGVCRVNGQEELGSAFSAAQAHSIRGQVIMEEFLQGVEATVEAFTSNGITEVLTLSDKTHVPPLYCVAKSLNYPACFPSEIQEEIHDVVVRSVDALDIDMGPSHTEVMVTEHGVKMIEIGARGGGARIFSDIIPLVTGIDVVKETVRQVLGEVPDVALRLNRSAILRFLNPNKCGFLKEVTGLDEVRNMPGLSDIELNIAPGDRVEPINSDADRYGYIIVTAGSRGEADRRADAVEDKIQFIME